MLPVGSRKSKHDVEERTVKSSGLRGMNRNLTSYGDRGFSRFLRRAFLASAGYDADDLNRPIVGIVDTSSDYNPCHREMPSLVQAVKRGVLEAGGLPFAFPTASLHEILISPTAMLFRNLVAMETEEMIRAYPMDAVVLLGGCDKTVPAQLMAAASVNLPSIAVVTGPMRTGSWRGERLGACTDCRRLWARHRAGELGEAELEEVTNALCTTGGTCMVMGTASTMACLCEALGIMLPGGATSPFGSGDRLRTAVASGRRAVGLAQAGIRARDILTRPAFENAMVALMALGGSTNAIIHLTAIARRAGIRLTLDDFQKASGRVPLLTDCKPSGSGYLEDFDRAGGMPVLMKVLEPLLDGQALSVTGVMLRENLEQVPAPGSWQTTIRTLEHPLGGAGALVTLRGSLAPDGAVIKVAAASPHLLRHRGPAAVFDSAEDAASRIDARGRELTPEHVLVLRNAGPVGAGMPEAGSLPIPKPLAQAGIKDMVRVSDARMSGTAYGACVLHCAPEAAIGGPLGLVRDGDLIELDVSQCRIDLLVEEEELGRRRAAFVPPVLPERGYARLHAKHVLQADQGADLDFMTDSA